MKSSPTYGSAKIYQFPVGGRAVPPGRHSDETEPAIDQNTPRVNETICSGSWYHEEAIRESKPSWER